MAKKKPALVENEVKDETKTEVKPEIKEDAASDNANSIAMQPSAASKLTAIAGIVDAIAQMTQENAINFLNVVLQSIGHEADQIPNDSAAKNAASIAMKPTVTETTINKIAESEILELFGDDKELSEEFKLKTATIFESALNARVAIEKQTLEEKYQQQIKESTEELLTSVVDKVDTYISFAADKWISENQLAIDSSLKNEISEGFMEGLKNLFAEHYIEVPEEKIDLIEELTDKVEKLEESLNNSLNENIELKKTVKNETKETILSKVSEGLSVLQKSKLKTLSENVAFDESNFESKLNILKNKFVINDKKTSKTGILNEEALDEVEQETTNSIAPDMRIYSDVISATIKK